MRKQLLTLDHLIQFMDPRLYKHLRKLFNVVLRVVSQHIIMIFMILMLLLFHRKNRIIKSIFLFPLDTYLVQKGVQMGRCTLFMGSTLDRLFKSPISSIFCLGHFR